MIKGMTLAEYERHIERYDDDGSRRAVVQEYPGKGLKIPCADCDRKGCPDCDGRGFIYLEM